MPRRTAAARSRTQWLRPARAQSRTRQRRPARARAGHGPERLHALRAEQRRLGREGGLGNIFGNFNLRRFEQTTTAVERPAWRLHRGEEQQQYTSSEHKGRGRGSTCSGWRPLIASRGVVSPRDL